MTYRPFDQREKLGEPPWSGVELEAWEAAHGHDARLKCYPEFGCAVVEEQRERLEAFARWIVAMDDPENLAGRVDRQTVTLTKIVDRAREALR